MRPMIPPPTRTPSTALAPTAPPGPNLKVLARAAALKRRAAPRGAVAKFDRNRHVATVNSNGGDPTY